VVKAWLPPLEALPNELPPPVDGDDGDGCTAACGLNGEGLKVGAVLGLVGLL